MIADQNAAYASAYVALVGDVMTREISMQGRAGALTVAVVRNLYKLMAYKDEYEVARLMTIGSGPSGSAKWRACVTSNAR